MRRRIPGQLFRGSAVLAVLAALSLAATGCGGSSEKSSTTGEGGSGVTAAKAKVAALSKPVTKFQVPGTPPGNLRSLSGKTVWYIPISQTAEFFTAVSNSLKAALAKAGVSLRFCNGQANPSATAACVNQAVASNAGAIIVDAIPIVV